MTLLGHWYIVLCVESQRCIFWQVLSGLKLASMADC